MGQEELGSVGWGEGWLGYGQRPFLTGWERILDSSWSCGTSCSALTPWGLTPTWREAPQGQADSENLMGQLLLILFLFIFLLFLNIIPFRFFSFFFTVVSTWNRSCMNNTKKFFPLNLLRASCQPDVLLLWNALVCNFHKQDHSPMSYDKPPKSGSWFFGIITNIGSSDLFQIFPFVPTMSFIATGPSSEPHIVWIYHVSLGRKKWRGSRRRREGSLFEISQTLSPGRK